DDPVLAEPPGEHRLPECVVQLVRAGVEEILALEIDPLSGCESLGERERRRPARVLAAEAVDLLLEGRIDLRLLPTGFELVEGGDERLRHVAAAVGSVQPGRSHRAASTNALTRSWSL